MKRSAPYILTTVLLVGLCAKGFGQEAPLYKNPAAPLEQRVNDLFGRLTQDEKLLLLGGTGFTTQPIPRLGVPAMVTADAGQGVRGGPAGTLGPATAFPCGVEMASTWDTRLISQTGQAIGDEARNKGQGVQIELGPAINIHRSPLGGRNGEYFTEDPFLDARLAVAFIQGLQGTGVAGCVKHYACNNQENDRGEVNVTVGERALREIYLPGFEAAVKEGNVRALMCAYNKVNGLHCSANPYLLKEILKKEWGFDGLVMSDWGAVHETDVVQAGNDLEMPTGKFMSVANLKDALAAGKVTEAGVDDSVRRILRTIIRVGLLDGPMHPDPAQVNSPEHAALALKVAEEGIVLLKNRDNLLPLDRERIKSIAVIGGPATDMQVDALGSPQVNPLRVVNFLDGIKAQAAGHVTVNYARVGLRGEPLPASAITLPDNHTVHGFRAEYFKNQNLAGPPALARVDETINLDTLQQVATDFPTTHFSARWTGELTVPVSGNYNFTFTGDDGFRIFLGNKLLIDNWVEEPATSKSCQSELDAGKSYELRVEYFQAGGDYTARMDWSPPNLHPYADAVTAAEKSDVAVVFVSTVRGEGEGNDRSSMDLPDNQAALVRAVAAVNKRTIVVLNNGTPVTMTDWLDHVPAVIESWFPGQEGGTALAAILFGDVNPSGKLPDTFAARRDDYPDFGNYPGQYHEVHYAEGIYAGYRHFDKDGIKPLFPFGYGLSYTTFRYSNLKLSGAELSADGSITASVDITNTGNRTGEEVAELYIHDLHPKIDKPVRELKGFAKVALTPGETKTADFTVTPRDLAYFDVPGGQWKADPGQYEIEIGASSRDIRQRTRLQLLATFTSKP
ncbi:MAG TPA: glycoside hydrolase family 3 C-terminal domain-containing protein [Verrucomicrobiae bacterium]|nr:glycoside hydrolase family 3 C-terminal domain-containing protein [Verrucomicrobiae bacterium]